MALPLRMKLCLMSMRKMMMMIDLYSRWRSLCPTIDWQRFFGNNYRPLEGMKAVHHFRFSQDHPGVVFYKTRVHDDEKSANVLRNRDGILPVIGDEYEVPIPGLSLARQKYLYEKIREFCLTDESKDKTCPAPIE